MGFWDGVHRLRLSEKRAFQKAKFAALYGLFRPLIEVRWLSERRTPPDKSKLEQSRALAHGFLSIVPGLVENKAADLHHHRPAVLEGSEQLEVRGIVGGALSGEQEAKLRGITLRIFDVNKTENPQFWTSYPCPERQGHHLSQDQIDMAMRVVYKMNEAKEPAVMERASSFLGIGISKLYIVI